MSRALPPSGRFVGAQGLIEQLDGMSHLGLPSPGRDARLKLHETTGVSGQDPFRGCDLQVLELLLEYGVRHLGLQKIVGTRRATAAIRVGMGNEFQIGDQTEKAPRCSGHPLCMNEMAGIIFPEYGPA